MCAAIGVRNLPSKLSFVLICHEGEMADQDAQWTTSAATGQARRQTVNVTASHAECFDSSVPWFEGSP